MENPCSSQGQCLQTQSGLQPGPPQGPVPLGHLPPPPKAAFLQKFPMSRERLQAGALRGSLLQCEASEGSTCPFYRGAN